MEALELTNQQLSRKLEAVHGGDLEVREMMVKLEELPRVRDELLRERQRRGELLHQYVTLRQKLQRGVKEEQYDPLEQQRLHLEIEAESLRMKVKETERACDSRIQALIVENQNLRDSLKAVQVTHKRQLIQAEEKARDNERAAEHYRDVLAHRDSAINELKQQVSSALCVVCWVQPVSSVTSPCQHACLCSECVSKLKQCPLCRTPIARATTIFLRAIS